MNTVYFDSPVTDDERRTMLYDGQLFVYSATRSSSELCRFARHLIEDAFSQCDPRTAQHELPVERYAAILGELKPKFIHHPTSKECIQGLLRELHCDPEQTYFDVPRMRSSTSDGYLTTGIAYAWHPHRDTWYSAPACQINWWMPIYEITAENAMAFHPRYWDKPLRNDSAAYNYAEWNRLHRFSAAQHVKRDPRPLPRATEPVEPDPQVRIVCPPGGIIVFSGAQLHSSVPNASGVTRFSIDFRTVHLGDAVAFRGAPNIDSTCTGTTMNDYLRTTDLEHVPAELVAAYDSPPREAKP